jgi:hypothetical protein
MERELEKVKKALEEAGQIGDGVEEEIVKDAFMDQELKRILTDFLRHKDEDLAMRKIYSLFSAIEEL